MARDMMSTSETALNLSRFSLRLARLVLLAAQVHLAHQSGDVLWCTLVRVNSADCSTESNCLPECRGTKPEDTIRADSRLKGKESRSRSEERVVRNKQTEQRTVKIGGQSAHARAQRKSDWRRTTEPSGAST